jgi:hypothetical protein
VFVFLLHNCSTLNPRMKCSYCLIRARVFPSISDPKLLQTLLTHSLRSLYGEFNPHEVEVVQCVPISGSCGETTSNVRSSDGLDSSNEVIVKTKTSSVSFVSAALTMTSLPPLVVGKDFICIDIVKVEQVKESSSFTEDK